MKNRLCLYGASGHGKVVKDIVESLGLKVNCFIDDFPKHSQINRVPVIKSDFISDFLKEKFIISIGNNSIRKKITLEKQLIYRKAIIHPSSVVSKDSKINTGSVVMPMAVVNADVNIGAHVIINTSSVVEHDCLIEDFVHISPKASIAGNVKIGEGSHIGVGANVIPNVTIGKWCTIGAGATIIEDVPDFAVVVGTPGKIIKFNKELRYNEF